jgi:O-antigen/teichoic acid export membrane protein
MSLARALALNTGVQILGKTISTALGIIIVGLMTRQLGTEGFGAYSTANAFLQVFALLLDLGLNVTLVAMLGEHAGDEKFEKRCTSALFTLRVVMAFLILGLVAPAVAIASPYPLELKLAIIALVGSFIFPSLNQVVVGAQQRHLKMSMAAVAENVGRVIALAGLLIAQANGLGLVPIMWFISLAGFANFILNFLSARKYADFHWNWDPAFWKMALHRSWPVGLSIAFGLAYFKADTLILSFVRPQTEVGIYGAAYRVLEILITIPFMYAGVLLPILSNAFAKKDFPKFKNLVTNSIDVMLVFCLPMMAGTWILGERIMTLVAGPEFAESGRILSILIVAVAAIYLNTVFSHIVVAIDGQRKMIPVYIAVAIAAVAGYLLFIPTYGMWAAAWLTVASEVLVGLGSAWVANRAVTTEFKPRVLLASIGATVLMTGLVWLLREQFIAIPVLAGALVYGLALYAMGGIRKETLQDILKAKTSNPPLN